MQVRDTIQKVSYSPIAEVPEDGRQKSWADVSIPLVVRPIVEGPFWNIRATGGGGGGGGATEAGYWIQGPLNKAWYGEARSALGPLSLNLNLVVGGRTGTPAAGSGGGAGRECGLGRSKTGLSGGTGDGVGSVRGSSVRRSSSSEVVGDEEPAGGCCGGGVLVPGWGDEGPFRHDYRTLKFQIKRQGSEKNETG